VAKIIANPRIEADVELLRKAFPNMEPEGQIIRHTELEALLKMRRSQSRYKTVTRKWRDLVFQETQCYLDGRTAEGQGFRVLNGDQMVRCGARKIRSAGKLTRQAVVVLAAPADGAISDSNARSYRARVITLAEQIALAHEHGAKRIAAATRDAKKHTNGTKPSS